MLSLGDSSYEFFCQTGKDFDERLSALGATAVSARVDCDLDYDVEAKAWITTVVDSFTLQTTHSVAHTFGTKNLNVTVYDPLTTCLLAD